jgi:hypothetical protein
MAMRIAALVLGLLGSFLLFIVGVLWTDNANHLKDVEAMAQTLDSVTKEAAAAGRPVPQDAAGQDLARTLNAVRGKAKASYPMVIVGLLAFVGSFFALKFPKVSGALMAIAVLVPAVLYVGTLFVSFLLALGALFALLAKPKAPIVRSRIAVALATAALTCAAPGARAQGALEPSLTKPLLGFDPVPVAGWTPRMAVDGQGVVYESQESASSIGVSLFKQRVTALEQLKSAVMDQFHETMGEVLENKTTPLGWYVILKSGRGVSTELIYVRTFGSKETYCRGRIATTGPEAQFPGAVIPRATLVRVCEALHMKK